MRIARLNTPVGPQFVVADNNIWRAIESPFDVPLNYTGKTFDMDAALLSPIEPRVLLGIAHNRSNNEHHLPIQAWHKSVHTLAAPGTTISPKPGVGQVNIEGELAIVIGRSTAGITASTALDYVFGYSIANDVTNLDQVAVDEKNFQAKSGTNYTPFGPWIETDIADPENVSIIVKINGEVLADSSTSQLGSTVVESLLYATRWVDLKPGDVIMTGSPKTFFPVHSGDRVDVTLAGIGTLTNFVS